MRLFLAISIPAELRRRLFEASQGLRKLGQMKLVEEENVHVTLKFLGEAEPEPVIKALGLVKSSPFEVSLKGIGVFPNTDYIKVIWAGCEKGVQEIITLHKQIESVLTNFEKDRDFHPHATIARVSFPKDKERLVKFLETSKEREFGSFEVMSFDLMRSQLFREGPKYGVVRSFPLKL